MAGAGGDESPGPRGSRSTTTPKTWSSIASLNISKRNKTNTLEVHLENDERVGFSLNNEEIERLLRRLDIKANQFTSVQACPERRNVVFITLTIGIDVTKFITNSNESFILKQGIRTTTIKPVNQREVNVQVFGLHPDTKDEAVIRYLNAHGQVNIKQPVAYGVYPGASGSSLLAGKRNGNRTYSMEVKRNIGSTHIIDGEKVSIKYPGQTKTCNKCHKQANLCPGKGLAKECSAEKTLLSEHMISYWKQIKFTPETTNMNEVDDLETETSDENIVTVYQVKAKPDKVTIDTGLAKRYGGVVIKGFKKESKIDDIVETLKEAGLSLDYDKADLNKTEKFGKLTIYVHDLKPEACVEIINNLNGETKMGSSISVYSLVEDTPTKDLGKELESLIDMEASSASTSLDTSNVGNNPPASAASLGESPALQLGKAGKMWADQVDNDLEMSGDSDSDDDGGDALKEFFKKRKAADSPDKDDFEKTMSRKDKKKLKQLLNKSH